MSHLSAKRAIVWNSRIDHSLEICWVHRDGDAWTFTGATTLVEGTQPFAIDYRIRLDRGSGQTQFDARIRTGAETDRRIELSGRRGGPWHLIGGDLGDPETLHGATCLDLGWTPLTNTFSIWMLDLSVGASAEITNAWVPFPEFTIQPSAQRYTRLERHRYRYEQPAIDFRADLDVDDRGFVRRYGDIWEAVTGCDASKSGAEVPRERPA